MRLRSTLGNSGLHWPAIVSDTGSQLLALLYQLQESERWSSAQVLQAQQRQLEPLLRHAQRHSPYYAELFGNLDPPDLNTAQWRRLRLLTRTTVLQNASALHSREVPKSHGRVFETRTSGSTGQPVIIQRTAILQFLWHGIALRDHFWQQRDVSFANAAIRANGPAAPGPDGTMHPGWGMPFDALWECGPSHLLDLATDIDTQVAWLTRINPRYLITYPTNLEALLEKPQVQQLDLHVSCVGETVSEQLHARYQEIFKRPLNANYSSQELGYIALQCLACGQYHVQSESVFVEVLNDEGELCSPGQVGRVVVTDLHNFVMPLIRYEIGDYAEVGAPCSVRPGLATLRQILGRRRNMVVFPDGRRHWPLVGFARFNEIASSAGFGKFNDIAPIRQYQFTQHTREDIEVQLVCDIELMPAQLDGLRAVIQQALGYPFRLTFKLSRAPLAKTKGGKFEEFVSLVS